MLENQFQVLSLSEYVESQSQVQGEDSSVNLRRTRLQRLQTARRAKDQEFWFKEGVSENTAPQNIDDLTFFNYSSYVYTTKNFVQNSVGNIELGIGHLNDAMYTSDINEVIFQN